jgi:MFS family permease
MMAASRTFRSLRNRNYRLYFFGQVVSMTGTWMQSVAMAWLVLRITGSGLALGLAPALQFLPITLAGPWGGVLADRFDKRKIIIATQISSAGVALALGLVTVTGLVDLWMVYLLALLLGVINLIDMPARQAFVMEMVGREDLTNAVSLNSVLVNLARIVGPALAGLLIATVDIGVCFLINAASYVAVIAGLLAMRPAELTRSLPAPARPGQLGEGLRYAWSRPELRRSLLLMAVVGTLAYNFSVTLPLLTRFTFNAGARVYGNLFSVMGLGAVLGGLVVATVGRADRRLLIGSTFAFGLAILGAALVPALGGELAVMLPLGAASTAFIATSNSLLQLNASEEMRGRIMALWTVVFLGTTPLGGPLVGWIGGRFGPRAALGVGGVATLLAAGVALVGVRHIRKVRVVAADAETVPA